MFADSAKSCAWKTAKFCGLFLKIIREWYENWGGSNMNQYIQNRSRNVWKQDHTSLLERKKKEGIGMELPDSTTCAGQTNKLHQTPTYICE